MEPVQLAAVLATAVVLASVLSVELGISVALLVLGVMAVLQSVAVGLGLVTMPVRRDDWSDGDG